MARVIGAQAGFGAPTRSGRHARAGERKKRVLCKLLTCRLHVLTLFNQQMLYNNVRTCSRGLTLKKHMSNYIIEAGRS